MINRSSKLDMGITLVLIIALACVVGLMQGCGGSLYKVKPAAQVAIADGASGAESGGIRVRAMPLLNDEEIQALFEANLLLAGILPVRVEMVETDKNISAPVDLKKARFSLRDAEGKVWQTLSPKKAVARVLDYYAVYLYNPNSRKKFEEELSAHAFNLESPLTQGEQRSGLIFFQTPKKEPVSSPRGLVLTIEKLPQSLELKLN